MKQDQIDRILKWGIVFSILWLAGIGSLFSIIVGLKTRKVINESNGALVGTGRAWWCLVAGGLGLAFWLPIVFIEFVKWTYEGRFTY